MISKRKMKNKIIIITIRIIGKKVTRKKKENEKTG